MGSSRGSDEPTWKNLYHAAMLELDTEALPRKGCDPASEGKMSAKAQYSTPVLTAIPEKESNKTLHSWKEIAAFLKCSVRSAQRWECEEGLPVHRHDHRRRGTVYALSQEIDEWLRMC